jgi:hypothetical protein
MLTTVRTEWPSFPRAHMSGVNMSSFGEEKSEASSLSERQQAGQQSVSAGNQVRLGFTIVGLPFENHGACRQLPVTLVSQMSENLCCAHDPLTPYARGPTRAHEKPLPTCCRWTLTNSSDWS